MEYDLGSAPAGAIVGLRIIDDRFARELSERTGAAVAFYSGGIRVASGAPEGFDRSQLDMIISDLKDVESDPDYKAKGRSSLRRINESLGVVYSGCRVKPGASGPATSSGATLLTVSSPLGFFGAADDKDKSGAPIFIVVGLALLAMGIGLALTWLEHTRPLAAFREDMQKLAKGQSEAMQPSKFRGVYRKIASDVNDGIDVAAAKTGGTRRAADLTQVLGDLPAEPQMSAFSFPGDTDSRRNPSPRRRPPLAEAPRRRVPGVGAAPGRRRRVVSHAGGRRASAAAARQAPASSCARGGGGGAPVAAPVQQSAPDSQNAEWLNVFEEFAATKQRCGESLDGFTFENSRAR